MTKTKARGPAHATLQRVQGQLSVIARTTSDIANVTNLSPATVRRCLTVLADEGAAAKNDQGRWVNARPPEGPTKRDDTGHSVVDGPPASRVGKTVPEAKAENTRAIAKASKKAAETAKTNGTDNQDKTANYLRELGFSEKLAEQDGALVDVLRDHGPLSRAQVYEKLGQFSDWSWRRMAEGRHGKLDFTPLIVAEGRGEERTWKAVAE